MFARRAWKASVLLQDEISRYVFRQRDFDVVGLHTGQEAARVLAHSIDFSRRGQIAVRDAPEDSR